MKKRAWDTDRARGLWEEGKTDLEIADMVGATATAVSQWRRREGLDANGRPPKARSTVTKEATPQDCPPPCWINVRERLPEERQEVVAIVSTFRGGLLRETFAVVARFLEDSFEFFQRGEDGYLVTHWMPLPEAPKEAKP